MAERKQIGKQQKRTDEDLASLLDNALKDFDSLESKPKNKSKPKEAEDAEVATSTSRSISEAEDAGGDKDFLNMISEKDFEKFCEEMKKSGLLEEGMENSEDNEDSSEMITAALKGLTESLQKAQSESESKEALDEDANEMCAMLETIVYGEILLPLFKENKTKLQKYLEDNKNKLKPYELSRYRGQLCVLDEICTVFQSSPKNKDGKNEIPDRIGDLVVKLQSYGPLPPEILDDKDSLLGALKHTVQANTSECSLM